MSIIKSINIEQFRELPIGEYVLGKRITIITGQNATGKSTLLGMLGQPFGVNEKDIWGKPLRSKFSEIFKFSQTYDKPTNHKYYINTFDKLHSDGLNVQVASYSRGEDSLRFVTGKKRESGDGNIDIPVIYLGLKRVFPLGETSSPKISEHRLTIEETNFFTEYHKKILIETNNDITPQSFVSKKEKDTIGIATNKYDSNSISAGQDNVGKILGSIISIQRYRTSSAAQYKGAILLIDEVDVTLHSASQRKLAEFLLKMSRLYNIQIAVTTHSLDFISALIEFHTQERNDLAIWHLYAPYGKLQCKFNPSLQEIKRSISLLAGENYSIPRINVFAEDEEAVLFLKSLIPSKIKQRINLIPLKTGFNNIRNTCKVIDKYFPSIWVLDGDQSKSDKDPKSIIITPGNNSVEKCMCVYLRELDVDDEFWHTDSSYTKQHFCSNAPDSDSNREGFKNWFNNERRHWGRGMSRLYSRWAKENKEEIQTFISNFITSFNYAAKRLNLPLIDK